MIHLKAKGWTKHSVKIMATSVPCFCSTISYKPKLRKLCPLVRSQCFHNQGNSANMVDASSMSVLRERIREVRKRERLEIENGWKYKLAGYDNKHKSDAMVAESIQLVGLVSSALGLVFLTGSLSIFLVSFVVHLYN